MLHDVVVCEATVATGFTVTLTVNAAPVQLPEVGVTLYTAVAADAVVLVRLSLTVVCPVSAPALPDMLAPAGVPHA